MKLVKLCAAMALLLATTACATVERPATADSACTALRTLTYANAKAGEEKADDKGNAVDTSETVLEIAEHNVRWRSLCASTQ